MRDYKVVTALASAARNANGDSKSTPIAVGAYNEANFVLKVTAASESSPTLDVSILTYDKTSDTWNTLTTFTQKTTTGVELKTVSTNLGYLIAFSWTVGGTSPSFTFSIGATLKG